MRSETLSYHPDAGRSRGEGSLIQAHERRFAPAQHDNIVCT